MGITSQHKQTPTDAQHGQPWSETQRMLVQLRDELYDGDWELFVADLKARLAGEPYIFEIGAASDRMKETIVEHLRLIEELQTH